MFIRLRSKYDKIAADENKKAETAYFGLYSIVISIVIGGLFVLGAWGLIKLIGALDEQSLGVLVIGVLIAIVALIELVLFAEYIFGGLLGVYYQFKCNRSPVSWISLAVYITVSVGMIVGIVFIANSVLF